MSKFWKICKYFLFACLGIVLLDVLLVVFFAFYHPKLERADAIVVLGAAINTPAAYNRSLQALKLYEHGLAPVIVLSGGQDFKGAISEAEYMRRIIESKAQNPVPMIIEDQANSTYENINKAKQELAGQTGSLIIVSDDFHLARGWLLAHRAGFGPVYTSSPENKIYDLSDRLYYFGREVVAILAYLPKFIIG